MGDERSSAGSQREGPKELRKSPRIGVHSRSFFAGGPIDGEGTMMNLSTKGCRIVSNTSMPSISKNPPVRRSEDVCWRSIGSTFSRDRRQRL